MAVHGVFISSKSKDGGAIDRALRERFSEVYRVGVEFWLVDTARDADQLAAVMRPALSSSDKMFVAALTRDTFSMLSSAARLWLTAPGRGWNERRDGRGLEAGAETPLAFAVAA
ncbi:hypothetical protein [Acuticoccus mangrovi]|uniref:Uncharacterized protein n=1 Tax=Acuticoccus mangrovi TaxID=2796142 RepID=A0A934MEH1_9HYPH|nr:hypothetical protein [Acuticoccus mangrovi]MBJ3774373.1 hypothetical protein [Acuticoccus mangrovi]